MKVLRWLQAELATDQLIGSEILLISSDQLPETVGSTYPQIMSHLSCLGGLRQANTSAAQQNFKSTSPGSAIWLESKYN